MIDFIVTNINLTQVLVLVTLVYFLFYIDTKITNHIRLLIVLLVCLSTEITALFLIHNDSYEAVGFLYSISILFHHAIWLIILTNSEMGKNFIKFVVPAYILFGLLNLCLFEGIHSFNYYTFVMGALLYVAIFIGLSFKNLKEENLHFFQLNDYILLFAPVMFFLGLSFNFCFRSHELSATIIFKDVKLYTFLNYFVNIIYYGAVVTYIQKSKRIRNE
ncbi:hypothetical protein [Flavobacterium sp. 25HG05S-40]|uniref:hypothetical protein n=1 Tax=Flavobacterium sp. 25HG05S-40 TaxID=3458682 RepID=UPI00404406DD